MDRVSHKLFSLLRDLENRGIYFDVARRRPDTITVTCTLVGIRIEIDVFEDGHFEYSYFVGNEGVNDDENSLMKVIQEYS
jgi:hypothetical protein